MEEPRGDCPDERVVPGVRHGDAAFARRREDRGVARGHEGERREDLREEHADRRGGRLGRDRRRARQPLLPLAREGRAAGRADREPPLRGRRPGVARQRRGRRRPLEQRPDGGRRAVRRVSPLRGGAAVLRRRGRGERVPARRGDRPARGPRPARGDPRPRRRADRLRRGALVDRGAAPKTGWLS